MEGEESQLWYCRSLAEGYSGLDPGSLAGELGRVLTQVEELGVWPSGVFLLVTEKLRELDPEAR